MKKNSGEADSHLRGQNAPLFMESEVHYRILKNSPMFNTVTYRCLHLRCRHSILSITINMHIKMYKTSNWRSKSSNQKRSGKILQNLTESSVAAWEVKSRRKDSR
jgi:hypothetical protein